MLWVALRFSPLTAESLERIAAWACQFTPKVSLEPPRELLMEVAGSLRRFGGSQGLLEKLLAGLAATGFEAAHAAAPTARAALWLARGGRRVLEEVPVEAACGEEALELLRGIGVRNLGELLALPREGLARRCGQALVDDLDEEDRDLLQNGLFIGRAIDSKKESLGRGDFLVRGVMGVDGNSGSIAIGDTIVAGERVQFHLRDARTAREDLEMMLSPQSLFGAPSGALLFSCNGRGTRLYDEPDGDISAITGCFRGLDVAGFFCAGEIGPIGGKNFLHGHTASLALIRSPAPERKNS